MSSLTQSHRTEQDRESLDRARGGQSWSNYPAIIQGFAAKGIPESEIKPRENVFTYRAWRALGRQVKRGEHGVRVTTYIPVEEKRNPTTGNIIRPAGKRPWTATVFHVSQTRPVAESEAA